MEVVFRYANSATLSAKDFIPIGIAVTVFVLNVIYQEFNKRNNIRDRLSSEVISTCDKMTRYAFEAEYSALTWKYWNKVWALHPLVIKGNEENNRNAINESVYYHRKLEDAGLKLDLLKSELKKSIKDLQKYWHSEFQAKQIIELMSIAVLKNPRRFEGELNKKYLTEEELVKDYSNLVDRVEREVVFNGLGFDLIRIQKIIDPKSPSMLVSHELEKDLAKKFNNTQKIERQEEIDRLIRNSR